MKYLDDLIRTEIIENGAVPNVIYVSLTEFADAYLNGVLETTNFETMDGQIRRDHRYKEVRVVPRWLSANK